MGFTVVTYGGGEILKNIFEAIAMLLNSQHGGFIRPLMTISISIGTLWAVSKAYFTLSAQSFLSQFIFPLIVIVGILMVPSTSVHIEDILKDRSYKVDHVPLLLSKFAELSSSVGYQVTKAIEKTMHVPNDVSYNSAGMLFGADTAMDISRYQITNADLDKNLRSFCKQCVLYDLHLGLYSIDELKKATDLWTFLEEKSSKVRMIKYTPIGSPNNEQRSEYLSCKDAIKKMTPYFLQEKRYYGQRDICKNLPLTFQALTGIQRDKEELISQQLMMNLLQEEYSGNNFAKGRAYLQQRNTYQVLGSLASSSLVTLRAVLEALVYAAFIFILPLSVLPGGVKYITTWTGLVLWIQLWPPFYAILNYIMQTVAHGYADTIFHGLSGAQQGLSLFTSIGLHNLQEDIYALSGYLAASIPFITYAILKGGVGSFIHLASSMMSPAHSAASSAAAEQTTGNYSFGNASFGQTSYKNTSAMQSHLAPSLSSGFFHENKGTSSSIHGADEQILKQSNSELRTSIFSDDSISQSLQKAQMHAHSSTESASESYSESIGTNARHFADLSDHLSKSESYSENISEREACDVQESVRYFQNVAENWGKQYGLSSRQSVENLFGVGVDFGVTAKNTHGFGSNKEHAMQSANNIVKSEEFQKNFQKLTDFAQSSAYNSLDDKGMRLTENYTQSHEDMKSSQQSYQIAHTELNQASENASWAEQNSQLIKRSLNQDFVNWASAKYGDEGGFARVEEVLTKGNGAEQESLVQGFVDFTRKNAQTYSSPASYTDPGITRELPKNVTLKDAEGAVHSTLSNYGQHFSNNLSQKREELSSRYSQMEEAHSDNFDRVATKIDTTREKATEEFKGESKRSLNTKSMDYFSDVPDDKAIGKGSAYTGAVKKWTPKSKGDELASNFQVKEEPFWMKKKEAG